MQPQLIVIAVVQRVSVFGAEPDVVVGEATVTRVECAVILESVVIVDCEVPGAVLQRAGAQQIEYQTGRLKAVPCVQ